MPKYIDLPPSCDGRIFKARPVDMMMVENPVAAVEEIEALTGARLRTGQNAILFMRRWIWFKNNRDPNSGVSFIAYLKALRPESIKQHPSGKPPNPDKPSKLSPSRELAWTQYIEAIRVDYSRAKLPLKEVYSLVKDENLDIPSRNTWCRYVREAKLFHSRGQKRTGE